MKQLCANDARTHALHWPHILCVECANMDSIQASAGDINKDAPEALALLGSNLVNFFSGFDTVSLEARRKIGTIDAAHNYFAVGTRFHLSPLCGRRAKTGPALHRKGSPKFHQGKPGQCEPVIFGAHEAIAHRAFGDQGHRRCHQPRADHGRRRSLIPTDG